MVSAADEKKPTAQQEKMKACNTQAADKKGDERKAPPAGEAGGVPEVKEGTMPRIIQLTPDGGGRYIAVDRGGDLWRGETKRQTRGGEEHIEWKPLPAQFPRDN